MGFLIAPLIKLALGWGLPKWASTLFGYAVPILGAIGVVLGAWALFASHYEHKGAAKVEQRVEREHSKRVAEARTDERAAQSTSDAIGGRVAHQARAATDFSQTKVKEIHDVIAAVRPAPAGTLAAAPVGELRDRVNAVVDRANRAAKAADDQP